MDSSLKKVRFSLPGNDLFVTNYSIPPSKTVHGTKKYINGMLTTVHPIKTPIKSTTGKSHEKCFDSVVIPSLNLKCISRPISGRPPIKPRSSIVSSNCKVPAEPVMTRKGSFIREKTKMLCDKFPKSPIKKLSKIKSLPKITKRFSSVEDVKICDSERKLSSKYKSSEDLTNLLNKKEYKNVVRPVLSIKTAKTNLTDIEKILRSPEFNKNTPTIEVIRSEPIDKSKTIVTKDQNCNFLVIPDYEDCDDSVEKDEGPIPNETDCIKDTKHQAQFWDFMERWRSCRLTAHKKLECLNKSTPVQSSIYIKTDVKRSRLTSPFRSFKMSIEQVPFVSTLLRAARDANEILLKETLRQILVNGISKEELNSTDNSGRTAISYICSTNLTNFLDIFLQIPGIDVNKPDNEGNSPLHFAAQAGQVEAVNMLLTRSRSLCVDAKNNLGFTPLMKSALQGRIKCAKLLLFAGASPVEVDSGRGLRAEQWARFCARYSCAEVIEKCSRTRLLEKTTSCRWSHDSLALEKAAVARAKTNPLQQSNSGSLRSKFRKVFPFGFSIREKPSKEQVSSSTDFVTYLTAAALCASGPVLPTNGTAKIIKSLIRPLEVPKLEITPANNQSLIKKYEKARYSEVDGQFDSQPPIVPPRGKMKK